MEESRGIVVLGMHRSGTSALAAAFSGLGFVVPGQMVPENSFNPKGHWEPLTVVEIHDRFLHLIGKSWSDSRAISAKELSGEAAATARREIGSFLDGITSARWLVKDPRMSRLVSLWQPPLLDRAARPRFVHLVRSPVAVAQSLRRRDGFGQEKSLLLWLRHNLEAELATRGSDRVWISMHELLTKPPSLLEKMRWATGGDELSESQLAGVLEEIIDPGLVHHAASLEESIDAVANHPWVASTAKALGSLIDSQEPEALVALDRVREELERSVGFLLGDAADWESETTTRSFQWLQEEVGGYRRSVDVQRREIEAMRAEFRVLVQGVWNDDEHRPPLNGLSASIEKEEAELAERERRWEEIHEFISKPVDSRDSVLLEKSLGIVARIEAEWSGAVAEVADWKENARIALQKSQDLRELSEGLRRRLAIAQREREETVEQFEGLRGERDRTAADRDRALGQLQDARGEVATLERALRELSEELARSESERIEIQRQRRDAETEIQLMKQRFSWRMMRPLRWGRGLFAEKSDD